MLREITRLDRVVTMRLVWPVMRARRSGGANVPILMYHGISRELDSHRAPYYRTVTSPSTFATHLRLLRTLDFDVITLSQAVGVLNNDRGIKEGKTPVVITFDDALLDFYTEAFPLLEKNGFAATVFIASKYVDGVFPTGQPCLSSKQIRELSQCGIEFGSHSVTHSKLLEQTPERLEHELATSKADIEAIVGREIALFSFPFRFPAEEKAFVGRLRDRLVASGYQAGVTTMVGRAERDDDQMFLPRLPVNDCDDESFFLAKLRGAYDWFGPIQLAYKRLRSRLIGHRTRGVGKT